MFPKPPMRLFPSLAIAFVLDYLPCLDPFETRKPVMAKIVTANTLAVGHVVFLAADGRWVETVADAATYDDANAAEQGLATARADQERGLIIDAFVTDKGPDKDGRPAMTLRDTIRAFGPTIRYLPDSAGQG